MKKITIIRFSSLFVFVIAISVFGCKKEKSEPEPESEPNPTPVVQPTVFVKVNGEEKKCFNNCYFSQHILGLQMLTLNTTSTSAEQLDITWKTMPKPGVYQLTEYGDPTVRYYKGSNLHVAAVTGTFEISSMDTTAAGAFKLLKAHFSFRTDTMNGAFFEMKEGFVNIK